MVNRNVNIDDDLDTRIRQKVHEKGYVKGDYGNFINMAIELYLERLDALDTFAHSKPAEVTS